MLSVIFSLLVLGISCYYLARSKNLQFIKVPLAYVYIWILKKRLSPVFNFDPKSKDPDKIGVNPPKNSWIREGPKELPPNIHASDSLRICGINKNGNFLFVSLARRHGRCAEIKIHLRLSNGEEYQHPCHPDTLIYNTNGTTFSAGGLTFELLEPLRRWRVIFRGYLRYHQEYLYRKIDASKDGEDTEDLMVQFNFVWHPLNNYVEFPYDYNTKYLANGLAAKDWFQDFSIPRILQSEEWHAQFGQLHGLLNIEGKEELELILRGLKARRNGVQNWKNLKQLLSFEGLLDNGTNFHLFVDKNGVKSYLYGYVCPPCNMTIKHITKFEFDADTLINVIEELSTEDLSPEELIFEAGQDIYKLKLKRGDFEFRTYGGEEWKSNVLLNHVKLTLNGKPGIGLVEHVRPSGTFCKLAQRISLPQLREPDIQDCPQLVLTFKERECQSSAIVGGKGSSLALMSTLKDAAEMFSVPKGVCITKTAFFRHLQENQNLEVLIDHLTQVAWNQIPGSLPDECEVLTKAVAESELLNSLKNALKHKLSKTFGNDIDNLRFAVRSSAIGEDGEEMSAAGQNETFLGIKGFDQIYDALLKCWASQFAFRSVEYKRQNGQLFNSGMGVVVQEMVPADIAGVLFTRDPMSGSAANMFITANYGLGESVVSATADPDTIVIKRTWDDILTISSEQIGKKSVMISMSEDGGTVETKVPSDKASKCTVDSEMAIKLGKIAIHLDRLYGSARDIEWAMKGKDIFLLQSRPVTTETAMLDFEIMHEFDSILRTDDEKYSVANIGEVMPGAMHPLTWTSVMRAQQPLVQREMSWKIATHRFDPTVEDMFGNFYGHAMFDRIGQKAWFLERKKGTVGKAWEIGIYGRVLDDDDIVERAFERFTGAPLKQRLSLMTFGIKGALFWKSSLKFMEDTFWRYRLKTTFCTTAWEAYTQIGLHLGVNLEALMSHMEVTMSSTIWNQVVLNMLSSGLGEFSTTQYSDFANIIGSGNGAESGDVPFSLRKLASAISKEIEPDTFRKMPLPEALEWLRQSKNESGNKFKEFLARHGHRGIKEFDLGSVPWAKKPESVIEVLQAMICNLAEYKTAPIDKSDNVIDSIETKLSPIKKKIFPWVTKQCRQAVCGREKAKSFMIKAYDNTRREYHNLADLMVKEGFIPDPELIFFFTHFEIGIVIQTRSPTIIRRAQHRRRLFPYMDRIKFPEMIDGLPKPIDENDLSKFEGATQVTGYPVSQGVITGLARVVTSFHEVNTIKPGEILITFSTDIGWSPYFPMLSGVVTEIGGLISHGAVVAREFGLPCIVGAQNATKVFKTGDTVLLNATKGVISKIE